MSQRINQILAQPKTAHAFDSTLGLIFAISLMVGCSGSQTTIPNPFNMADRVPPPIARTPAPGTAQPYYPGNTNPGAVTLPPGAIQQAPLQQSPLQSAPLQSAPGYSPQPTFQTQPQPYGALPANSPAQQVASLAGDSIAIPTDSTALRFGSPTASSPLKTQPTYIASNTALSATANSWVSGSAPVRTPTNTQIATNSTPSSNSLRVRVPGATNLERRPISVASLQPALKQVQIQPLPVNDPNETVGWR